MKVAMITGNKTVGKSALTAQFAQHPSCRLLKSDDEITTPLRKELENRRTMEETFRLWKHKYGVDYIEKEMQDRTANALAPLDTNCLIAEGWIYHSHLCRRALYSAVEQIHGGCHEWQLYDVRPTIDVAIERLVSAEKERHGVDKFVLLSEDEQRRRIKKMQQAWEQRMELPDGDERQFLSDFQIVSRTEDLEEVLRKWFDTRQ